jgi:AcrR family transcriptional regulator
MKLVISYKRMNEATTRESLLDAAESAFAEGGFRGATVRQITGQAKANLGAVTYHFGSKAALFEAVVERAVRDLHEALVDADRSGGAPPERLERLFLAHFGFLHEHPRLRRVILQVLLRDEDLPTAIHYFRRAMGLVAEVIAEGQKTGDFRPGDPVLLAISAMTQSVMFNLMRPMLRRGPGLDLDKAAVRRRVVDHALAFVRAGVIRPRRGG